MSLSYFSGTIGGAGLLQQGEALQGALRGPRDGRDDREVLLLLLQPLQHSLACQQDICKSQQEYFENSTIWKI